jgi:ribonuclease VapC
MIVDSSALIAILRDEPDAPRFAAALADADEPRRMAMPNWLEAAIVIDGSRDPIASARFDALCTRAGIEIVAATADHGRLARQAYRDYGKDSGHPAQLNFGDCFAYALARETGERLLFKGSDFSRTDIAPWPLPA